MREEKAVEEACEKEARKEEAATTRKERSSFQFEFIKEVVAQNGSSFYFSPNFNFEYLTAPFDPFSPDFSPLS